MNKINRNTFLKNSIKAGAFVMLSPIANNLTAHAKDGNQKEEFNTDSGLMSRLVTANDKEVAKLLKKIQQENLTAGRQVGHDFAALAAAYVSAGSPHFKNGAVLTGLEKLIKVLIDAQSEDGTLNLGNVESPPDTAFLLEPLSAGAFLLKKEDTTAVAKVNNLAKDFIRKSGHALVTGGVHTPNHRWVISAALAKLNAVYSNPLYLKRINEWLAEGIYNNDDGHYPERSRNYDNVENNSMITMARLLNKPALYEPARKNLRTTYYYMEPNGDLVTTDSRRQDQYSTKSIVSFYLHYRHMAIKDKDGHFASVTKLIENMAGFEEMIVNRALFHFLEDPLLQQDLPAGKPLPVNFEKLFATSSLLRIRRNDTTTTLFGGADWPLIIASGRSNSPNFFTYRKGKAHLQYMRLSTNFFSMGYFYSEGLRKSGNQYVLSKELQVPYYQPLPKNLQNAKGDYKLTPSIDGRFWNKMDFKNRLVSNLKKQETKVTLNETNGSNQLNILVNGPAGVRVTIELCFKAGGRLTGVTEGKDDNYFLEQSEGLYEYEGDSIRFGPGIAAHRQVTNLEGERYSTHFGSLRTEGMHVYLTGVTPFSHTLTFS